MAPPFINTRQGDQRLDRARQLVQRQLQQRRMQSQMSRGRMGEGGVGNLARNLRQKARPQIGRMAGFGRAGGGPLGLAKGRGANFQFTDVGFAFPGNPNPPGLGGAPNPGAEQAWNNAAFELDPGAASGGAFSPVGFGRDLMLQGGTQTALSPEMRQQLLGGGGTQTAYQGGALGGLGLTGEQTAYQGGALSQFAPQQQGPQPGMSSSLVPVGGGIYFNPATGQFQGMPGGIAMM